MSSSPRVLDPVVYLTSGCALVVFSLFLSFFNSRRLSLDRAKAERRNQEKTAAFRRELAAHKQQVAELVDRVHRTFGGAVGSGNSSTPEAASLPAPPPKFPQDSQHRIFLARVQKAHHLLLCGGSFSLVVTSGCFAAGLSGPLLPIACIALEFSVTFTMLVLALYVFSSLIAFDPVLKDQAKQRRIAKAALFAILFNLFLQIFFIALAWGMDDFRLAVHPGFYRLILLAILAASMIGHNIRARQILGPSFFSSLEREAFRQSQEAARRWVRPGVPFTSTDHSREARQNNQHTGTRTRTAEERVSSAAALSSQNGSIEGGESALNEVGDAQDAFRQAQLLYKRQLLSIVYSLMASTTTLFLFTLALIGGFLTCSAELLSLGPGLEAVDRRPQIFIGFVVIQAALIIISFSLSKRALRSVCFFCYVTPEPRLERPKRGAFYKVRRIIPENRAPGDPTGNLENELRCLEPQNPIIVRVEQPQIVVEAAPAHPFAVPPQVSSNLQPTMASPPQIPPAATHMEPINFFPPFPSVLFQGNSPSLGLPLPIDLTTLTTAQLHQLAAFGAVAATQLGLAVAIAPTANTSVPLPVAVPPADDSVSALDAAGLDDLCHLVENHSAPNLVEENSISAIERFRTISAPQ